MTTDRLSPTVRTFVTHWGEMGTRWGINRTVAQIHALLFISGRPLNADDLVTDLGVARSNVSMSLKELAGWGLATLVHLPGDRRDHFTTTGDVWELTRILISERKRREFDPTLQVLAGLVATPPEQTDADTREVQRRLKELHQFMTTTANLMDQLRSMSPGAMAGLVGAAGTLSALLPKKSSS